MLSITCLHWLVVIRGASELLKNIQKLFSQKTSQTWPVTRKTEDSARSTSLPTWWRTILVWKPGLPNSLALFDTTGLTSPLFVVMGSYWLDIDDPVNIAPFWLVTFHLSNTGTGYPAASRNSSPSTKMCWKTTCDTSRVAAALTPHRRGRRNSSWNLSREKWGEGVLWFFLVAKCCDSSWNCTMEGGRRQQLLANPFRASSGLRIATEFGAINICASCRSAAIQWPHVYLQHPTFINLPTPKPNTILSTCRSQCLRIKLAQSPVPRIPRMFFIQRGVRQENVLSPKPVFFLWMLCWDVQYKLN